MNIKLTPKLKKRLGLWVYLNEQANNPKVTKKWKFMEKVATWDFLEGEAKKTIAEDLIRLYVEAGGKAIDPSPKKRRKK